MGVSLVDWSEQGVLNRFSITHEAISSTIQNKHMISLQDYSTDLVEKDGILFSRSESRISYPESGNKICFELEDSSFWFGHRNQCIIQSVKRYCPDALFFDIGGGNGFVSKGLEEEGINTVLIEPGLTGCENARQRGLRTIVCSTLENASFKKNSLPAAGLFDVVEHIEQDVSFLQSVADFLKPGGYVFLTVPAYRFLWSNEDVDAGHFRRYTLRSMEKKINQAGLRVVYSSYIFALLPVAVFLFRTLPSKLGFNKHSNDPIKHKEAHSGKHSAMRNILQWILNLEISQIKKGRRIPFGGSCFVIAQKPI